MKILGLCAGRKMGNSEILVKEALMAAEEKYHADVEIVRLMDCFLKPCIGCNACGLSYLEGGLGLCVIKGDDMPFLREKILESDGIIVGVPVYNNAPPGYLRVLNDRMGPAYDVEFVRWAKKKGAKVDERFFKSRPIGFIAVGGGPKHHIFTALPLLSHFAKSMQFTVVDQFGATMCAAPGQVLLDEEAVKKAGKLGERVASQLGKPKEEIQFLGDEDGNCPHCHSNLLMVENTTSVMCPLCGQHAKLKVDGDKVSVVFDSEDEGVWGPKYREWHIQHIGERHDTVKDHKAEIDEKSKKYKTYKTYSKPVK